MTIEVLGKQFTINYQERKLEPEDKVLVITRPESVKIKQEEKADFFGLVSRATYLGPTVEYEVDVNERVKILIIDYSPKQANIYREGEKVRIVLSLEHLYILPKEAD